MSDLRKCVWWVVGFPSVSHMRGRKSCAFKHARDTWLHSPSKRSITLHVTAQDVIYMRLCAPEATVEPAEG